jgi:hypothetical protein
MLKLNLVLIVPMEVPEEQQLQDYQFRYIQPMALALMFIDLKVCTIIVITFSFFSSFPQWF